VNKTFWHRKAVRPILALLQQGITPEKIALSIALGMMLGVTPVLGSTTILCVVAAAVLRLNLPAIQLVNYLVYPLQLALLVPFIKIGEKMFGGESFPLSLAQILDLVRADTWHAIVTLWTATMHALAAWLALGSLAVVALYFALLPALRRLGRSLSGSGQPQEAN
jgi:uncharacterized protein (DUF2062 family)